MKETVSSCPSRERTYSFNTPNSNRGCFVGAESPLQLGVKLQYFGHLMRRVDSLEKTLMLGGIGGRRRRG